MSEAPLRLTVFNGSDEKWPYRVAYRGIYTEAPLRLTVFKGTDGKWHYRVVFRGIYTICMGNKTSHAVALRTGLNELKWERLKAVPNPVRQGPWEPPPALYEVNDCEPTLWQYAAAYIMGWFRR